MQGVQLRKGAKLEQHDPSERLKNPQFIFNALIECLKDGDAESFKEILSAHLEVINKAQFSKRANIPSRTLFRMLTPEGNPTLDNISKIVHALEVA